MMRIKEILRKEILLPAGLLALTLAVGCTAENTPVAEHAATAAATHWLHSVDVDSLAIAYDEAGALLREQRSRSDWTENVKDARDKLGEVLDRQLQTRRFETEPPRHPDGSYVIVGYQTDFANRQDVEELLVMRLNEGIWRTERYIIDPGP